MALLFFLLMTTGRMQAYMREIVIFCMKTVEVLGEAERGGYWAHGCVGISSRHTFA